MAKDYLDTGDTIILFLTLITVAYIQQVMATHIESRITWTSKHN